MFSREKSGINSFLKPNISIEPVKYGNMPSKQWYMSPRHTDWYYHSNRMIPSDELLPNFLDATLDDPLRLLALGLISLGYTTLPSCSGHYRTEEDVNKTYFNLLSDANEIRGSGLELIDAERGDVIRHQDKYWYLPWDRREFGNVMMGSNGKPEGYLGFQVPRNDSYTIGKVVDYSTKKVKGTRYKTVKNPFGYTFELRVHTGKQKTQDRAWEDLGDAIMSKLV